MGSFALKIFATRSTHPAAMSPIMHYVRPDFFAMESTRHAIPSEAAKWSASVAQVSSAMNLPKSASIASLIPIAPTASSVLARRPARVAFAITAPHLVAQTCVMRIVTIASIVLLMTIAMMVYIAMASIFVLLQVFARLGKILALLQRHVAKPSAKVDVGGAPMKPPAFNRQIVPGRRLILPVSIRNHALNALPRQHVLSTVQIVRGRTRTNCAWTPTIPRVDRSSAQVRHRHVRGAAPELKPTIPVILLLCAVAPVILAPPTRNAAKLAGPKEGMPTHAAKPATSNNFTP